MTRLMATGIVFTLLAGVPFAAGQDLADETQSFAAAIRDRIDVVQARRAVVEAAEQFGVAIVWRDRNSMTGRRASDMIVYADDFVLDSEANQIRAIGAVTIQYYENGRLLSTLSAERLNIGEPAR